MGTPGDLPFRRISIRRIIMQFLHDMVRVRVKVRVRDRVSVRVRDRVRTEIRRVEVRRIGWNQDP